MLKLNWTSKSRVSVQPFTFRLSSYSGRNNSYSRIVSQALDLASFIPRHDKNLVVIKCEPYRRTHRLSISSVSFKVDILVSREYRYPVGSIEHKVSSTSPLLALFVVT